MTVTTQMFEHNVAPINFPGAGQTTTDYEEFREILAKTPRRGNQGDQRPQPDKFRTPAEFRNGKTQANVSRIEREEDVYLSTLRKYVQALGGRLELCPGFPDETVSLCRLPRSRRSA